MDTQLTGLEPPVLLLVCHYLVREPDLAHLEFPHSWQPGQRSRLRNCQGATPYRGVAMGLHDSGTNPFVSCALHSAG
jgi:hypothetical protein